MKRIGLIIPEIADPLDYELLDGIYRQAAALDCDVIVFTGILNSMPDSKPNSDTEGFENIYSLICTAKLDGILFAANRFHDETLRQKIFTLFAQTSTPVLTLDFSQTDFPCIIAEQHDGAYAMTKHLIEEHACKKLWCIAGFPEDTPSLERLRGFKDAMQESGLPIEEDAIHFGYYWKEIPEQLAREIAAGKYKCPDGVVCLSDTMAIYFEDELQKNGISVPEQVKVTGYDGMWYSAMHNPVTTTVCGREKQLGEMAVCRILEMITGEKIQSLDSRQTIRYGTSCGCSYHKIFAGVLPSLEQQVIRQLFRSFEKRSFLTTDFISQMKDVPDLNTLMTAIDSHSYLLHGWKQFDIALCEDWCPDFDNPYTFRQQGFSDSMLLVLSKNNEGQRFPECRFPTAEILPFLQKEHTPMLCILTSLHCKGQIFGYCVQSYDSPDAPELDDAFVHWTEAVSGALHNLQKQLYIRYLHGQMEMFSTMDAVTELPNKRGFTEQLPDLLHRLRKSEKTYSLLFLSWMDGEASAYDTAVLLGNVLKKLSCPLCARLGDKVFAILLTEAFPTEDFLSQIRADLNMMLGNTAFLPDFITEEVPITEKKPSELEKETEQLYQNFLKKREIEISHNAAYREQLYQLRHDMTVHPELEWSITEISRMLGISRTHLQRLYKEQFSASIKDDLIHFRMNRAVQLLSHTDLRVQEIAEQCGYHNENHFMRQFKEKNGMTAMQYRKQFRN